MSHALAKDDRLPVGDRAPDPHAIAGPDVLSLLLHARRTDKMLADSDAPDSLHTVDRAALDTMLADAAMAPFHYPHPDYRGDGTGRGSAVPWTATKLDGPACRSFARRLVDHDPKTGGIARMMRAASALVLVWFTPEGEAPKGAAFAGTERNMEHVAAAGAFAQSFLLAATAAGHRTYWSSGGIARGAPVTSWLDVPAGDVLVGALFVFPREGVGTETKPGAWRGKRGRVEDWSAWRG